MDRTWDNKPTMTKLTLGPMYPPPGAPSNPPTWEDIERLSRHYPVVYQAVTMVERGDWTREQALIAVVYALAGSFSELYRAEIDRLQRESSPLLVAPKP